MADHAPRAPAQSCGIVTLSIVSINGAKARGQRLVYAIARQ